jgi:isocitrate dehydrogenase (NAD+)
MLRHVAKRAVSTRVTLIPGDGIGPEVMACTQQVLAAVNAPVEFDTCQISEVSRQDTFAEDIAAAVESMRANKLCLKGHILAGRSQSTQKLSMQMQMNREMDCFAHVAHITSYEGIDHTKHKNVDFVVVRETTEGEYCGEEHEAVPGVVESLKVTTTAKCERIARFAFDYALKHDRKKVTCVHKANIMKKGDGLFMRTCNAIAKEYEGKVQYENMIVDNTCMQLVSNPWQFDVMVTPNLYGNIVENLGAGLIGGAGVLSGAHYGGDIACFGPAARYTYLSGAGKDIANPTAMFMSAGHLLKHIGAIDEAMAIKTAVRNVIKDGKVRTRDIGGFDSQSQFTAEVIRNIK